MRIKGFGGKVSLFVLFWCALLVEETFGSSPATDSDKDKILLSQVDTLKLSGKKQTIYRRTVDNPPAISV
jgi:hypothetical protein